MLELAFTNLTTRTHMVDAEVGTLDSEIDGGNSDRQAHMGGSRRDPVGHNEG